MTLMTTALISLSAMFLGTSSDEAAFSVSGEARVRGEALQGQFRSGVEGGDQAVFFRTLIHGRHGTDNWAIGAELQDSRVYLDDEDTTLSSSFVNALDFLQLYIDVPGPNLLGGESSLRLGRQTVSIGSKRQIERVSYANVIKSYTGGHLTATSPRGDELHAIYVVPMSRFPNDREEVGENKLSGDEEQWERRIWGIHYRRQDILPNSFPGLWGEAFVYGLNEADSNDVQTPNRQYLGPGGRLYRKPAPGQWDVDIEGVWRIGERRASSNPLDKTDLKVNAQMLFAAVGRTFDAPWQPRLALEWYYTSGDDDPTDDQFDQYERLFGSRRTDLNNTSLHGPLTPANLNAPGIRLEVKPNEMSDARLYYHAAFLSSETDVWTIAKLRDPTGQSGNFIGHVLDSRWRRWIKKDRLRLDIGASALLYGEFAQNVPGGPSGDGTLAGYAQLILSF